MGASNFYNSFSILYPLVDIFLRKQKGMLTKLVSDLPRGKLLEIGVGNGSHLKDYQNQQIIAIDISSAMLANAKKIAPCVEMMEMNGEELAFPDQNFDYVVISHTIAVAEKPEKMISEAYRVLKPTGKLFILNHFTPKNPLRIVDYAFQPFAKLLHFKSVFYIESIEEIKRFKLLDQVSFGKFAYFKLLIFSKP